MQRARGGRWGDSGDPRASWDRDRQGRRRGDRRSSRGGACQLRLLGLANGHDPRPRVFRRFGLQVVRARRGHDAKRVLPPLERDGSARVHILQFEKPVQLVLGRSLVVGQVRRTQDEPPPLPGLFGCQRVEWR